MATRKQAKKRLARKKGNTTRVVILGAGQIGTHLMQVLSQDGYDVLMIDEDEDRVKEFSKQAEIAFVVGNGTDPQIYIDNNLQENDLFLAVTNSDETNLIACRIAKAFGCQTKIARVRQPFYREYENTPINKNFWKNMGVEVLFNQSHLTTQEIERLIENRGAIDTVSLNDGRLSLIGYRVKGNSLLCGRRLVGLRDVPKFQNLIVAAVTTCRYDTKTMPKGGGRRFQKEETIIPRGDYKIQESDLLYLCGKKEDFEGVGQLFDPDMSLETRHIFILGGSVLARELCQDLLRKYPQKTIYLIEPDKRSAYEGADKLNEKLHILNIDPHNLKPMIDEGLDQRCVFIAASNNEDDNLLSCLLVKEETRARTISLLQNPSYMHLVPYLSIDAAVSPKLLIVDDVLRALRKNVYDVVSAKGADTEIMEFVVAETSIAAGQKLQEFRFPANSILIALFRNEETIIPQGNTRMQPEDHVVVLALRSAVKDVQYIFLER